LLLLGTVWAYFIKIELAEKNNFKEITKFSRFTVPAAAFEVAQVQQLKKYFSSYNPMLWLFCQMQYYCFIRPGELRLLKIENIFLETAKICIPAVISKNKKAAFVAIPLQLLKVLQGWELFRYPANFYLFSAVGVPAAVPIGVNTMSARHRVALERLNYHSRYKLNSYNCS
jgi:integrase